MKYNVDEKMDEMDKLLSLNKAAQEAVLYRKYLTDKLALEKKFEKQQKALNTAKVIIDYAFLFVNKFKLNHER